MSRKRIGNRGQQAQRQQPQRPQAPITPQPQPAPAPLAAADAKSKWWDPSILFAALSFLAAAASAWAAIQSKSVASASERLSELQYRPQVAITAQESIPPPSDQPNIMAVSLKNVGPMTIYNAELRAEAGIFDKGKQSDVWFNLSQGAALKTRILIAPTEEQIVHVRGEPLSVYGKQIAAGTYRFVVAVHLSFVDDLGRPHNRYLCTEYVPIGDALQGNVCDTPQQS